jgi:hypothetical protein
VKRQGEGLLVSKHVLAERGAELRQALDDLAQALLRCAVECGAGSAKRGVVALEHPLLLGGQAERVALPHQCIDAAEQRGIGAEFVPVAGDLRRQLALNLQERVVTVGADQEAEDLLDARQCPAAQFEGGDGINEVRRGRLAGDGVDLGLMFRERARIGGSEVPGLDGREWRDLIGRRPVFEKRVIGVILRVHEGSYQAEWGALYRDFEP